MARNPTNPRLSRKLEKVKARNQFMGRYYWGDIEGKFWFGVQSSDDASFFGGEPTEPTTINFSFTEDDIKDIEGGIKKCEAALGEYQAKLAAFFSPSGEGYAGYTDAMLGNYLGLKKREGTNWDAYDGKVHELLEWYARLELGRKILKSVKDTGQCCFEAET
jgi:hypothetical protein